jgi:3-(3-hydroxy-phenyl)propionate hydroxylase
MGAAEAWKFAPAYELPSWPFVTPPDLGATKRRRYPGVPLALHAAEPDGALARHLGAAPGTLVLVRPDAYVAARIAAPTAANVEAALRRALALAATRS